MYIESSNKNYEIESGHTSQHFDVLRSLPHRDLVITVYPKQVSDYVVKFYLGEELLDTVTRIGERRYEKFAVEGSLLPNNPNANWVEQERGGYVLGPRASVVITNSSPETIVFTVSFSAVVESFITS